MASISQQNGVTTINCLENENAEENKNEKTVTVDQDLDDLNPDFRAGLGLLAEEDEGLTEIFKARLGLEGMEEINQITEVELALEEERDKTLSSFMFNKYAKKFQGGATASWINDKLPVPLLPKKHNVDELASLAIWGAIQKFMGDGPPTKGVSVVIKDRTPVMTKIYRTLEMHMKRRNSSANSGPPETRESLHRESKGGSGFLNKLFRQKSEKGTAATDNKNSRGKSVKDKQRRKSTTSNGSSSASSKKRYSTTDIPSIQTDMNYNLLDMTDRMPTEEMDLIHFIIGHGILRRDLRDEIYCMICKQLTNNPSAASETQGWILLSLTTGCFAPSDDFIKYFRGFLKNAPQNFRDTYATYTWKILKRTMTTGLRYHPPNWLEFQASKMQKYVMLPVNIPGGRMESLEVDAASTASEMCSKLANAIGLKDQFGFSVYISLKDKVSSLGSGSDHVMDAISECEQIVRIKGIKQEDTPWKLYFRKEIFTPWHDPTYDDVGTNMIYLQICKCIRTDEYYVKSEDELAMIAAQQYFVDNGNNVVAGKLTQDLPKYLPDRAIQGNRTRDGWTQCIINAYDAHGFKEGKISQQKVKEDLVCYAQKKWTLQFSGMFQVHQIAGPRMSKSDVLVAINSRGFFMLEKDKYKVVMEIPFYHIVDISNSRAGKIRGQSFSIITVRGAEFSFISTDSVTIAQLLRGFLDGLRRRSKYAVGLQKFTLEGVKEPFSFQQGDVLELIEELPEGVTKKDDWCYGRCTRSNEKGIFPYDGVYVIPCLKQPPQDFLKLFLDMSAQHTATLPRQKGAVMMSATIGRDKLSEA